MTYLVVNNFINGDYKSMITKEQQSWISHLSNTKKIKIIPYNPEAEVVFGKIKREIQKVLGEKIKVFHRGSTKLKISGQGEIDLYIPVNKKDFNNHLKKLLKYFGEAGTIYPLIRARFVKYINGIKVEIFLINKNSADWKNGLKFENYLKNNCNALSEYEKLKKRCDGFSVREYYKEKINFINEVLEKNKYV